MKLTLVETNPVILLNKIQDSIRNGYRLIPNKSLLDHYLLYDITLYKEDTDINVLTDYDAPDTLFVESYDSMAFLFTVQMYVVNDYEIVEESVNWFDTGTKRCTMKKANHLCTRVFEKQELQDMDYEDLKTAARVRGCFNRSRDVMVSGILNFQEGRK